MPSSRASDITKAHNIINIKKQLLAGQHRTMPNLRVMKVFKKAELITTKDEHGVETFSYSEAFPRGDFNWWHNPHWGDDEYAIIIPLADVPTFERMRKKPRKDNQFCYDFEMEEIDIDLMMMTYCEISRYNEDAGGQYAVLRTIGRHIEAVDEISKQLVTIREGFMATVRLATYTEEEAFDVKIALQVVGEGIYRNTTWMDVPQDYVESMASGRMGPKYEAQRLMAVQELERRKQEKLENLPKAEPIAKSLNTAMPSPPLVSSSVEATEPEPKPAESTHQCEAIAMTTGQRCRARAILEINGRWYCKRHAAALKPVKVGGEQ